LYIYYAKREDICELFAADKQLADIFSLAQPASGVKKTAL